MRKFLLVMEKSLMQVRPDRDKFSTFSFFILNALAFHVAVTLVLVHALSRSGLDYGSSLCASL